MIHRVLNLGLYLVFCFMVGTGLLLEYRLIPGGEGGHGLTALGLSRHEWGDWHFWLGVTFLIFVILHLWMNRAWLVKIAARSKNWPLVAGLIAGIILTLSFLALPIERKSGGKNRGDSRHSNSHSSDHGVLSNR